MNFTLQCPVYDSFRVRQIEGMFDVPIEQKSIQTFSLDDPPPLSNDWQIGLIVGPSGSGKSTVARRLYSNQLFQGYPWPENQSVLDAFPESVPVKEIIRLFTTVGFSSPPSWIKPYSVLSNGEKFRCDLAIALALQNQTSTDPSFVCEPKNPCVGTDSLNADFGHSSAGASQPNAGTTKLPLLVFDEFTSVVDRTVAMASSVALAKNIRSGLIPRRFLAVTCHYDCANWLEPDWILDMADGRLERRRLRREELKLEIVRTKNAAWELFKKHHYLSGSLSPMSVSYLAILDGKPVGFAAVLPLIGMKGRRRFTRLVVLPDYQGLGIGMKMTEAVAQIYRDNGLRINLTASHPCVVGHCKKSPLWRAINVREAGSRQSDKFVKGYKSSCGRAVVSFEYFGRTSS